MVLFKNGGGTDTRLELILEALIQAQTDEFHFVLKSVLNMV